MCAEPARSFDRAISSLFDILDLTGLLSISNRPLAQYCAHGIKRAGQLPTPQPSGGQLRGLFQSISLDKRIHLAPPYRLDLAQQIRADALHCVPLL